MSIRDVEDLVSGFNLRKRWSVFLKDAINLWCWLWSNKLTPAPSCPGENAPQLPRYHLELLFPPQNHVQLLLLLDVGFHHFFHDLPLVILTADVFHEGGGQGSCLSPSLPTATVSGGFGRNTLRLSTSRRASWHMKIYTGKQNQRTTITESSNSRVTKMQRKLRLQKGGGNFWVPEVTFLKF